MTPLIADRNGEVHVTLNPALYCGPKPTYEIIEEQIREVLELPGAATATMLTIKDLDIATETILRFVQSRKWNYICLDFWRIFVVVQDPSVRDLVEVATRRTVSLALSGMDTEQTTPSCHVIGPVLEEEGTNIQRLRLEGCLFRREEAAALASGLRSNQTLRALGLRCCKLEEDYAQLLAASLTRPLDEIALSHDEDSYLHDREENPQASMSAFISSIPLNCCPRKLHIAYGDSSGENNPLLEGPLDALGNLLSGVDCDLENLYLEMYGTGDCIAHSFEHFSNGLRANHSLRKLMLRNLHLSDELAGWLAGSLQQHSTLQEVDVEGANLTDRGFSCIGQALLAMPSLKSARIEDSDLGVEVTITTETADLLAKAMETNYCLEEFCLGVDYVYAPSPAELQKLQNRQAKVDVYCILNRAGRQTYIERPTPGASKGLELELSILEKVNNMRFPVHARTCPTLRVSALYEAVVMMAESFAAISE